MAEKGCGRDAPPPVARRPSFRKSLRENAATLPPQYLEALEQKRKQLDESIHKYVAAKEREYKQYEKDVRQQAKAAGASPALVVQQDGQTDGNGSLGVPTKRRTSAESTQDTLASSPLIRGQHSLAVNALMATGLRRESNSQTVEDDGEQGAKAGPAGRRVGEQREKDFVGLFTPPFLPAIDNRGGPRLERTESAPSAIESSCRKEAAAARDSIHKAESDNHLQAKTKRPAHLQVGRRTSSSGSSADGKLASAMKSPTQNQNAKPKRKRVSLAVGDSIVAPSDNVPVALGHNSRPSHSRTHSPANEREHALPEDPTTSTIDFTTPPAIASRERVDEIMNGVPRTASDTDKEPPAPDRAPAAPVQTAGSSSSQRTPSQVDPDGDLFDFEEEEDGISPPQAENDDFESAIESEEDVVPGIGGRIEHGTDRPEHSEVPMTSPGLKNGEHDEYDPEAGLIPEPTPAPEPTPSAEGEHAVHLEFGPAHSSGSSQQPTKPGFRRPSVVRDPVFRSADYQNTQTQAANEEIYGSSFTRPTSKGSFTGGSLGESFMAKHAEEMMRSRVAKQQDVRS